MAALCLVVGRAATQSITTDEADSFLGFAGNAWAAQWYPHSANHVFNSLLERLSTLVFPLNELTVRLPAVLGAVVYIAAAMRLCLLIARGTLLACVLFVCLVFNPLVLDYLIAARGYSLAMGFLASALAVIADGVLAEERDEELERKFACASVLVALSFASNFSFAFAGASTMVVVWLWASYRKDAHGYARLAGWCFLPGIVTAAVLVGPVVWNWPPGQLYFGSQSVAELWRSVTEASFDELNPEVANAWVMATLGRLRVVLPWVAVLSCAALLGWNEWRSRGMVVTPLVMLTRLVLAIGALTFLVHWIACQVARLPLPKDRTALFFVLFATVVMGCAVAVRGRGAAVMVLIAVYFAGCLRLGYFKEWWFNADSREVYFAVENVNLRCGISEFVTEWRYPSSLNFYRRVFRNRALPEFEGANILEPLPEGKAAYVLYYPEGREFFEREGLKIVYRNEFTGSAVGVRGCE